MGSSRVNHEVFNQAVAGPCYHSACDSGPQGAAPNFGVLTVRALYALTVLMRRGSATGRQLPVPVYASGTNSITNRSIVNGSVHRELQDQDPAARKTYDPPDSLERPVKPGQFDASTNEPPAEYLRVCPGSTTATMPVPFEALLPYVIMTGVCVLGDHLT